MKKVISLCCLLFLTLGTNLFANSYDFSVSMGVPLEKIDYKINSKRSMDSTTDFVPFMLTNYNMFGETQGFGFFESLSVLSRDYMSIDFLVGPAYFAKLSDNFTVQTGLGFHMATKSHTSYKKISEDESLYYDTTDFLLGVGLDLRFKFIAHRRCTPILGLRFVLDPYCGQSIVYEDGTDEVTDYQKFLKFSFMPSLGFCMNF